MSDVIAPEVAEAEFKRWVEAMDLTKKTDPTGMDEEDKKSLLDAKDIVLLAICSGHLVVTDDGSIVYTPKIGNTSPITFPEPDGKVLLAMDQKRSGHDVNKTYAALANWTKETEARFINMKRRDWVVVQAVFVLFFA